MTPRTGALVPLSIFGLVAAFAAAFALVMPAAANQPATEKPFEIRETKGEFDDVVQDIKDSIVDRGFVIDYVGDVGRLLQRTAKDVGLDGAPYDAAQYVQFCPAKITNQMMTADPRHLANCPITVFAYQETGKAGVVQVGYRLPLKSENATVKKANAELVTILRGIVEDAMQ